jgi:hypothetical protein
VRVYAASAAAAIAARHEDHVTRLHQADRDADAAAAPAHRRGPWKQIEQIADRTAAAVDGQSLEDLGAQRIPDQRR